MTIPVRRPLFRAAAFVAAVTFGVAAAAASDGVPLEAPELKSLLENQKDLEERDRSKRNLDSGVDAETDATADVSGKPKSKPGPETTDDRDRILGDLYARLSTADNPDYAKLVETAIHKMWLFSGSDTVDLLMKRAQTALAKKNDKVATDILDAVVSLDPTYAEGWNRRAFVHFSKKDYGAALRDLRRTLVLDPRHFKAIGGLAVILREYGKDDAALRAYRKALEVNPLDIEAKKAVKELEVLVEGQKI